MGKTIAIVDAYDDPNAESDLGVYRSHYGLGWCAEANGCFRKVNQKGETIAWQKENAPTAGSGWAVEISLDLDMASAICPGCDLLLVEANSNSYADLAAAEETAAKLAPTAISNSFGGPELESVASTYNSAFSPNIPVFASSGDSGYGVSFPASVSNVIAVGGTTLHKAENPRGWSETAWAGAGSGCSYFQAKPAWQTDTGCAKKSVADVSAVADPKTPLSIYDSYCWQAGCEAEYGWVLVGGTSASSPILAALEAKKSSAERELKGKLFWQQGPEGELYDVSDGRNGACDPKAEYLCDARVGYDGPTGWGTLGRTAGSSRPVVGTYEATSVTTRSATLNGGINPTGKATTYHFEYGLSTSYGQDIPVSNESVGSGSSPVSVSAGLSGLRRDTTYHYRLVATNELGTTYGADETFVTSPWSPQHPMQETKVEGFPSTPRMRGVSCASKTFCAAVGWTGAWTSGQSSTTIGYIQHWNGSEWLSDSVSLPSAEDSWLYAVSCTSATFCMASGEKFTVGPGYVPFAERWSGSEWTSEAMPAPNDAFKINGEYWSIEINEISCASSTFCMAVGSYFTEAGETWTKKTLTESWNGSEWQVQPSPSPAAKEPNENAQNMLEGVSCPTASYCVAVGYSGPYTKYYKDQSLLMTWNGSQWSQQSVPSVPERGTLLHGVSCASASACMAVGSAEQEVEVEWEPEWTFVTGSAEPLAYTLSNGTWTLANPDRPVNDVSCSAVDWCVASGGHYNAGEEGFYKEFEGGAEQWNGSEWSIENPVFPSDAFKAGMEPEGVSCAGTTCETVGRYSGNTGELPYASRLASSSPHVLAEAATEVTVQSATLHGKVDPEGADTTYEFEYGTSTSYGTSIPVPAKAVGHGMGEKEVSAGLSGLSPHTNYHYRLAATNAEGTSYGKDQTFTTPRNNVVTELESESYPMSLVGQQDPTSKLTIEQEGTRRATACEKASLNASSVYATSEPRLKPEYQGCTIEILGKYDPLEILANSCEYTMGIANTTAPYSATFGIVC
ncbi:MAG TPA: S8 family serine peptidase, partial [Solirubrobacterales bacterium]|nr:S8 family serine peptidase [Solirubrobacterales bacterium]